SDRREGGGRFGAWRSWRQRLGREEKGEIGAGLRRAARSILEIQKKPARSMLSHSFPGGRAMVPVPHAHNVVAKKRIVPGPAFSRLFRSYVLDNIR
ncbi:MAG: hypothetical protein ACREX5_18030, partial [Achromobacter pestifer]